MLVIGHRGASAAAPENTPEAFALADSMGADGVELDVRLGPDGRLVVYHDTLPSDPARLAALPDLAEVLEACGDRMLVNVEIKNDGEQDGSAESLAVVEPTIAELVGRGADHAHRWLISSFSSATIERCREVDPSVPTAFLVMLPTLSVVAAAELAGHVAIHPHERSLDEDAVGLARAAGLAVNTWTCNDPDRIVELARIGVDGVCTDVPDVALEALGRSGPDVNPRWVRRRGGTPG